MATTRGQAATEYIIMFAVVVIIAIIVAGVLGGFPTISGGIGERESSAYWTTSQIAITKHHISLNSNNSVMTFRNNQNYPIFLERATFNGVELIIGRTLAPGTTVEIKGGDSIWCPLPGTKYYFNVTIYYTDLESGSELTFIGERPLVGTCQN